MLRISRVLVVVVCSYILMGYCFLPMAVKKRLAVEQTQSAYLPEVALKFNRIPGDPLNIAVVGTECELRRAMGDARWHCADPLSARSVAREVKSIIGGKSYFTAPVSNLYCFGRRQDLAFEQIDGKTPLRRHHVRFWRVPAMPDGGRPLWIGAATFDRSIGLSRLTGQITHHISNDVDAERDKILRDIQSVRRVEQLWHEYAAQPVVNARNGEGDRYFTDGRMTILVLPAD